MKIDSLPYDWVHLGRVSAGTGSNTPWPVPGPIIIWQIEFELIAGFSAGSTLGYMIVNLSRGTGYLAQDGIDQDIIAELTLTHSTEALTCVAANKTIPFVNGIRITSGQTLYLNVHGSQANDRPYGQAWIRYTRDRQ